MSENVRSILEDIRRLTPAQRADLMAALSAIETSAIPNSARRREIVLAIKGKYRYIPTSSEAFLSRKYEDTSLES